MRRMFLARAGWELQPRLLRNSDQAAVLAVNNIANGRRDHLLTALQRAWPQSTQLTVRCDTRSTTPLR